MATARLSSKCQIVVPAEVREQLGLKPGDRVTFEIEGDHAVLRKPTNSPLEDLLSLVDPELHRGQAGAIDRARDEWDR